MGAEPLGVTNCLNFGNPEKPTVAWQLSRSIEGLGEACRELGLPVVGGNVSLYNETPSGPIYPTPVIGMVGEVPDHERSGGRLWNEGDTIALVGPFDPSVAGSELEKQRGELGSGLPGAAIGPVRSAIELVRETVRGGTVATVTDVSDGGLATAVAELSVAAEVGCRIDLRPVMITRDCSPQDAMFGEGPGGFIVAGPRQAVEAIGGRGVQLDMLGEAGGETIEIAAGGDEVRVLVGEASAAFASLAEIIEA